MTPSLLGTVTTVEATQVVEATAEQVYEKLLRWGRSWEVEEVGRS